MKKVLNPEASGSLPATSPSLVSQPEGKLLGITSCGMAVAGALPHGASSAASSLEPPLPAVTSMMAPSPKEPSSVAFGLIDGDMGRGATCCSGCTRGHQAESGSGLGRALAVGTSLASSRGRGTAGPWRSLPGAWVSSGECSVGRGSTGTGVVWVPLSLLGGGGGEGAMGQEPPWATSASTTRRSRLAVRCRAQRYSSCSSARASALCTPLLSSRAEAPMLGWAGGGSRGEEPSVVPGSGEARCSTHR